ncbi:nucleotide exchange factor GrpE [Stratiformator vulcanicus]|uniref:Protein GrpE n=1 Tax=Stratiformator vulcanicus TaxID=2527980 RepID=A0A517QY81_9PLAN|nr:nucleotide exchange factor GrpE [Stratiformator vulcanicus]QDT36510.1 heat shock protein GrpE [Stratiformator vulcanicus]
MPDNEELRPENQQRPDEMKAEVVSDSAADSEAGSPEEDGSRMGLEDQLEAARAERDEAKDKYVRAHAEFDNFRKRIERERADEYKYRSLGVARDVLPALDNLRRALEAAEKTGNVEELVQGVEMVSRQFEDALKLHGIERIAAEGRKFDPNLHEALTQVPSPDHEPMTVLQEVEPGYKLHDRVIRPSKVVVVANPS